MPPNLIFWGVFLLAFVFIILLPYTYQKRRTKKFEHYAQQRGFSFTTDGSDLIPRDLDKFYASGNRAVSQRWYRNVIYGELHGVRFFAFEYRYRIKQTWNRNTTTSKPQTLILFVNPSINFPHFDYCLNILLSWIILFLAINFLQSRMINNLVRCIYCKASRKPLSAICLMSESGRIS